MSLKEVAGEQNTNAGGIRGSFKGTGVAKRKLPQYPNLMHGAESCGMKKAKLNQDEDDAA